MSLPYLQPYLGLSNGLNTLHAAGGPGGAVGGWVELGRISGTGASSTMTVSSLADKRYYMFLLYSPQNAEHSIRFNGDTGSNYATRESQNGGADGTRTSNVQMYIDPAYSSTTAKFSTGYIANYSTKEKLLISHTVEQRTAGAANAPYRWEVVGKHAQTSNPISSISAYTPTTNWTSNDQLVVLGWDPADSHTNNFWGELASVTAAGGNSNFSSGTISAKKYLWVQLYHNQTRTGTSNLKMTFNNITTGTPYATRKSDAGGADGTFTSQNQMYVGGEVGIQELYGFYNFFIINNSANEKLVISHANTFQTTGSGTAPYRHESVHKWANTSSQITEIDFDWSNGTFDSSSIMKVWGAD